MADRFANHAPGLEAPYSTAFAITPHDTNPLSETTRAIYVGGAGNISLDTADGQTAVVFVGLPVGTVLRVRATRVRSTSTTATNLVGLS